MDTDEKRIEKIIKTYLLEHLEIDLYRVDRNLWIEIKLEGQMIDRDSVRIVPLEE